MTLTQVNVQNAKNNVLTLPLSDTSGGFEVRDIQGLDPVKASLVSSQMAQVDGAQLQNTRRDTRNITMKVGIKPDYLQHTVQTLRTKLYDYFLPKASITLSFYLDGVVYATIQGTVESCENNMFSADPEVNISIICYDPDFYAPASVIVSGNTVASTALQAISYAGSSPAGIIFTLNVNRDIPGFKLYNTQPDGTLQIFDYEGTILNGDTVIITSIPLKKSAMITRNQQTFSGLYYVQAPSDWINLENGINDFRCFVTGAAIPYTIEYLAKYGGI